MNVKKETRKEKMILFIIPWEMKCAVFFKDKNNTDFLFSFVTLVLFKLLWKTIGYCQWGGIIQSEE